MCHGLWESWISTMVAWPCPNDFSHHGLACKRLLRQCTPGTSNGNNTWDLVFCMTRKLPAKFVDPAHRKGPQVVVHDKYTSRHRSQCCTLRWGFLKMGDTKCHSKWFVAMWARKPMVRDTVIVKVSWLMQTCGDPTGPMQIRHIWKGPWFDRHVTSARASGVSHWFPPTQGQTLFQCSSCDNYTTNAMNCCNCFFPRVHHGEIHINWNVFNFNRKLQYLATILEHLHTPVCGHDCIEVGKCHEGIHFTNGSFAWTLSLVHVLFQNIGKSERQQQQNKKTTECCTPSMTTSAQPKTEKINKVRFRIARIPCA